MTVSGTDAVAVTAIGLWLPGYPSADAWAGSWRDEDAVAPKGLAFDRVNRRRAGVLCRAIADAAAEAMTAAGADAATIATVVGSSIGEASTMIGLLDQMWRTRTPMSPAAFTVSVHNAASGLLSISTKNRGYTTSLAADEDTPAAALFEGIGLVQARRGPVVVICADEECPRSLVKHAPPWGLLAAAVVLAPADVVPRRARLRVTSGGEATLPVAPLDSAAANNPQAGLVDLVDAIARRTPGMVRLDRGTGHGYLAQLDFEGAS